jgi:hypothetical protein
MEKYQIPDYVSAAVETLRINKYGIADPCGIRVEEFKGIPVDAIGILAPSGRMKRTQWLGNLYFHDDERKASPKRWVLGVYGRISMKEMYALAKKLSKTHGVDVSLHLEGNTPEFEVVVNKTPPYLKDDAV